MSKTVEEILDNYKYLDNPFHPGTGLTKEEAVEAINQLLIEAKIEALEDALIEDGVATTRERIKFTLEELQSTLKKDK